MIEILGRSLPTNVSGVTFSSSLNSTFALWNAGRPRSFCTTRRASACAPWSFRIVAAIDACCGSLRKPRHVARPCAPSTFIRWSARRAGSVARHARDVSISAIRARAFATSDSRSWLCFCIAAICTCAPPACICSVATERCAASSSDERCSLSPNTLSPTARYCSSSAFTSSTRRFNCSRASRWPHSTPAL